MLPRPLQHLGQDGVITGAHIHAGKEFQSAKSDALVRSGTAETEGTFS